jgi:hypothetical protein
MFKKIEKQAACKMQSVIRFLNARNMKQADAMSDSIIRRWVRNVIEGCVNVQYDLRSSRLPVVNEDLVHAVEEKIQENRRFTISSLSKHFPQNFMVTSSRNCV